jgi:hypothetical protein
MNADSSTSTNNSNKIKDVDGNDVVRVDEQIPSNGAGMNKVAIYTTCYASTTSTLTAYVVHALRCVCMTAHNM